MMGRSDRIFEDLEMSLEPEIIGRFKQNVIVRRWIPLAPDMEFRGYDFHISITHFYHQNNPLLCHVLCSFVYGGQLNALTQYNYPSYFPRLVPSYLLFLICSIFLSFRDILCG
jgi:hypothetical protein